MYEKNFPWQNYIDELDSIVLDVIEEELSRFNKYLLKHLSFSNALSISSLADFRSEMKQ